MSEYGSGILGAEPALEGDGEWGLDIASVALFVNTGMVDFDVGLRRVILMSSYGSNVIE